MQFWDAPLNEQRPVVVQLSARAAGVDTNAKQTTKRERGMDKGLLPRMIQFLLISLSDDLEAGAIIAGLAMQKSMQTPKNQTGATSHLDSAIHPHGNRQYPRGWSSCASDVIG